MESKSEHGESGVRVELRLISGKQSFLECLDATLLVNARKAA